MIRDASVGTQKLEKDLPQLSSEIREIRFLRVVFAHRIHTHSVYDAHTVCSQARTNVNACL